MTYKIYKMNFKNAHFGDGQLDVSVDTFSASRMFSALYLEAMKMNKEKEFFDLASSEEFVLSDAFPYFHSPFLPKPIGYPTVDKINAEYSNVKEQLQEIKKGKNLKYLDIEIIEDFLEGEIFENESMTKHDYVTKKGEDPYFVGVTYFKEDASLYVISIDNSLIADLMRSLSYTGIGGKISSGYGGFELEVIDADAFEDKLTTNLGDKVMLLTSAFPIDSEVEKALEDSKYLLNKDSGFIFSKSSSSNYRKNDFYKFVSGSTFNTTWQGSIKDVAPKGFEHPVYNYAKPLFFKLEVED